MTSHPKADDSPLAGHLSMLAPQGEEEVALEEAWQGWLELRQQYQRGGAREAIALPEAWEEALLEVSSPSPEAAPSVVEGQRGSWQRWFLALSAPFAGAVGLWMLLQVPASTTAPPQVAKPLQQPPQRMAKGFALKLWYTGASLGYKAKARVQEGDALRPGDQIQLTYENHKAVHAVIASLNQRGEVSILAPLDGKHSLALKAGKGAFETLELDEYIGKERIFALISDTSFSVARAKRALKQAYLAAGKSLGGIQSVKGPWRLRWSLSLRKLRPARPKSPRRRR